MVFQKIAVGKDVQPIRDVRSARHPPSTWDFAVSEGGRIAAHWEKLATANPHLWNGGLLMCHRADVIDGIFHGSFFMTDYAGFVAWRDWGYPGTRVYNCFGVATVRARDGALLYGRMAAHTLNPGMVHPPGGSLGPDDVRDDGSVDLKGSIIRELREETWTQCGGGN